MKIAKNETIPENITKKETFQGFIVERIASNI
jgi:hypothetical protein